MEKNLCPENNITFENSQTVRFETPIPDDPGLTIAEIAEAILYYEAWSGRSLVLPDPTCRQTMLIKKILDPSYELPFTVTEDSCDSDRYLWDLINGTTEMLAKEPKTDMAKYFHLMLGGTVDAMPDPNSSFLSYWMNQVYLNKYKKE